MNEVVIKELGGGPEAVIVIILLMGLGTMGLVVRALWTAIQAERERTSEVQASCTKDTRELQISTLKTLNDVDKSLTALTAAIRERRREDER